MCGYFHGISSPLLELIPCELQLEKGDRMKRVWLAIFIIALGSASAESCQWDQYLGNPGRTAYTTCSAPDSPEVLWEIVLDGVAGIPFIVEDRVIIMIYYHYLSRSSLEEGPFTNVRVIDLLTGTLIQKVVPEDEPSDVYPVGDLIVGSGRNLWELNMDSQEMTVVGEIPQRCSCIAGCHPLILDNIIVFPTTPVVCLSRDDYSTLWDLETILGPLYPKFAEVWSIAASTNQVYIVLKGEDENRVLAVDADTGAVVWMKDLIASGVAAEGEVVYFVGEDLYALDAKTGESLWVFNLGFSWSNIAIGPQAVYVIDDQNYLYAVNKYTGKLRWKSPWQESDWIDYIIIAQDTIICSNILNLSAFSAENGKEIWKLHFFDYPILSAEKPCPAIAEGILVFSKKEIQEEDTYTIVKPEKLVALASDPDVFVKQGDTFLSMNMKEEAINSYRKAQELYKKKGNETQSQKMEDQILELENLQETAPPETTLPESENPPESLSTPPTPPESPPPSESTLTPILAVVSLVSIGVFIAYYIRKKH